MDDNVTYGVCWKTAHYPDKWFLCAGWFSKYMDALSEEQKVKEHSACIACKIVERVETFEDVPATAWERGQSDTQTHHPSQNG